MHLDVGGLYLSGKDSALNPSGMIQVHLLLTLLEFFDIQNSWCFHLRIRIKLKDVSFSIVHNFTADLFCFGIYVSANLRIYMMRITSSLL